jgi:hypothetical protein
MHNSWAPMWPRFLPVRFPGTSKILWYGLCAIVIVEGRRLACCGKLERRILSAPQKQTGSWNEKKLTPRVIEHSACAGDQFLAGTKNIWWLSFCVDPLPVAGQVVLMRESLARLSGRFLSLYTRPMLCLSTGPSFKITETSMSCVPPHLLQRAKILY